ncbi:phosphatidate cytidylyltransferase [Apilactobacillus apisilvae]|uniref:Phosphatidate cytidylyltransferase n=1 Tax=Apilactobacillus apisilvae TaxID=2923364 RepID=A0ABY4PI15_9LACO|nr:phosphatidate cytidylyltransferase [Apilactobacillus apisilvae]UQS85481.1 phosphatidate cytidylyltransferase [Apilactobacillus apisilvae]
MKQRVLTAIIALIIFIPVVLLGGIFIDVAAIALGIIAVSEALVMKKKLVVSIEAILSFIGVSLIIAPDNWFIHLPNFLSSQFLLYIVIMLLMLRTVITRNRFSFDDVGVLTLSMFYVGIGFHYFISARSDSISTLFYALFIVWITDSGAYIFGKKFGKNKLAPHVSPNKTWEGSICGSLLATVIGTMWMLYYNIGNTSVIEAIFITLILSIVGQFGDLVESALKRYYRVKDSGKILPGHGGILDRFDSLLFVLPILHLFGIV